MANVRDSNLHELAGIINKDNIKSGNPNILDDIDGSIYPPTDYSALRDSIFNDSSVDDKSEVSAVKSLESEADDEESDDSGELSNMSSERVFSGCKFNDITIEKPLKNVVDLDFSKPEKAVITDKTHSAILSNIETKEKQLIKANIPVPHYRKKDIERSIPAAKELLETMKNLLSDHRTADSVETFITLLLKILCTVFNGRHQFRGFKIDLTGYDKFVMMDLEDLRDDNMDFAGYAREKFGQRVSTMFTLFRIFVIHLGHTLYKNNSAYNNPTVLEDKDYRDTDSDDEEEDDEEEEEEEEESE